MKFSSFIIAALCAATSLAAAGADDSPAPASTLTTGCRVWHTTDGKALRLRLIERVGNTPHILFQGAAGGQFDKSLDELSPEDQAYLADLKSGKLQLVKTPGLNLNPDLPAGKIDFSQNEDRFLGVGKVRTWQHSSGKKIEARLVNLTDSDVSLLVGDFASRVDLKDLSVDDIAYIERLKKGEERMFHHSEALVENETWDGGIPYRIAAPGERYEELVDMPNHFEQALAAAVEEAGSKLGSKDWEMERFVETTNHPTAPVDGFHSNPSATAKPCVYYVAEIKLTPAGYRKAQTAWPLTVTPKTWPGPPELRLYILADGKAAAAEPAITR